MERSDESAVQVIRSRIIQLPPSMGGIALGSVGLAGTIRYVGDVFLNDNVLNYVAIPFYVLSAIYVCTIWIRIVLDSALIWTELRDPPKASTYGPFVMAMGLLFEAMVITLSENEQGAWYYIGVVGIYSMFVMQLVLMAIFFQTCWIKKCLPEPFWFPVTVSIAITGLTGGSIDMPRFLQEITFWSGLGLTVVLLPIVLYRTTRYPDIVATNPTINILQAPVSFVAITWFAMEGSEWVGGDEAFAIVLFTTSMVMFLITGYAVGRRRKYICGVPFSGTWSAFTFPTISTVKTAVHFADFYYDRGGSNTSGAQVLRVWAITLCFLLLPFVLGVILVFTFYAIFHPRYLLPPTTAQQFDTENSDDEEHQGSQTHQVNEQSPTSSQSRQSSNSKKTID